MSIGVVGAGTMGNGIAQVAARAGYNVIMHDVREEFLDRGMSAIDKSLQRDVDKERLDAEDKAGDRRTHPHDYWILPRSRNATFVIEAVTENLDVKTQVFKTLDQVTPPRTRSSLQTRHQSRSRN